MANSWGKKIYPCRCEINKGFLWVRCCETHKLMCQTYPQRAVMAAIILQKHPEELDGYEDQLVVTQSYTRWKDLDETVDK